MNKSKSVIITVLFFFIITSVSLLTLFTAKNKTYLENEKRYSAEMPKLSFESLMNGDYFSEFENYIADRIFGRSFFVATNSYLKLAEGRGISQDIILCKEGYIINAPKKTDNNILTNNLSRFDEFCLNNNLKGSLVFIPSPGEVMKSILPFKRIDYKDNIIINESKKYKNIKFIDTTNILESQFNKGDMVYYKTDHHLTSLGSYYVYKNIMEEKGLSYIPKEEFSVKRYEGFSGTTKAQSGYFLSKSDIIELWDCDADLTVSVSDGNGFLKSQNSIFYTQHLKNDDKYPVFADGNHAITKIKNNKKEGRNLLIIKDSYAHCLATFLCYEYENIYMLDLRYYRASASEFIKENNIDEVMFVYGANSLFTDTNSAWLF